MKELDKAIIKGYELQIDNVYKQIKTTEDKKEICDLAKTMGILITKKEQLELKVNEGNVFERIRRKMKTFTEECKKKEKVEKVETVVVDAPKDIIEDLVSDIIEDVEYKETKTKYSKKDKEVKEEDTYY